MERLLRPERFEGSQDTSPAQWTHWLRTFSNFVQSISPAPDKLKLLINYISPEAYSHISDCENYEDAINALKAVYVKPKNIIYARHQLATRRQLSSESIDTYLHSLKILAKDCDFTQVTADTYTQEAMREAFIAGLASPAIRQRLLEKETLTLSEAVQLARSLDSAQRNAEGYCPPLVHGNQTTPTTTAAAAATAATVPLSSTEDTSAVASRVGACFFCGGKRHPRARCPARMSVCHKCAKKGHFASVCRSDNGGSGRRVSSTTAAASAGSSDLASVQPCHHCASPMAASNPVLASASTPTSSTIPVSVNGLQVNSLVDSGSSISFIHPEVVKNLNLIVHPSKEDITLASSETSTTLGHCFIDLVVNDCRYPRTKLSVLPRLCSRIILGRDFMGKHEAVEFTLNGSLPKLTICGVACMNFNSPSVS